MFSLKIAGKELISFGRDTSNVSISGKEILKLMGGGSQTDAGIMISEESSLTYSAVYAAVRCIAESLAMLPLQLFQKTENGREALTDHRLYYPISNQPNNFQTSYQFRETLTTHQCLWGNAYAYILRDRADRVSQLIPLHPSRVNAYFDSILNKVFYLIDGKQIFEQSDMIHFPALSCDGISGKSPIRLARENIGLSMATQKFGARFFGNGANPDVVMEHPGQLGDKAIEHLRYSWLNRHGGIDKSHNLAILEEGMKLNKLSIPPEESQFLQTRQFQVVEVARWFRVQPHMIADLSRSTFSNIEAQDIGFVKYTLLPWLKRWEQQLNMKLLTEDEKSKGVYWEFNLDALLRGDIQKRGEFYTKMRTIGVLNANEIRTKENMNLREDEGGKSYENPNTSRPTNAKAKE